MNKLVNLSDRLESSILRAANDFDTFNKVLAEAKTNRLTSVFVFLLSTGLLIWGISVQTLSVSSVVFFATLLTLSLAMVFCVMITTRKVSLLKANTEFYELVLDLPYLSEILIDKAKVISQNSDKVFAHLERLDEEKQFCLSKKGKLLLDEFSLPGVKLQMWERWVFSEQGIDAPIQGLTASFTDNTSKFSTLDGSVTTGFSSGRSSSTTYSVTNQSNLPANTVGNTNSFSRTNTKFSNTIHTGGSATVHIVGKGVNSYLTFDDPHFAARVANEINLRSEDLKTWKSDQKKKLNEIDTLILEENRILEQLKVELGLLEQECPQATALVRIINDELAKGKFDLKIKPFSSK